MPLSTAERRTKPYVDKNKDKEIRTIFTEKFNV